MKKISILLAAAMLLFAAGCRDEASLDGLESQTKEQGVAAGETTESKALATALSYVSTLEYNWVMEYAPTPSSPVTILFDFQQDKTVSSDAPLSDKEKNLAIFSILNLSDGGMILKFDGPTMLSDAVIDSKFRERQLLVKSVSDTQIECTGLLSGIPATFRRATQADVSKLGEKLVWTALAKQNAMLSVLRDAGNSFVARYTLDKNTRSINFTWIDATTQDAMHQSSPFELVSTESSYTLQWTPVSINDRSFSSLTYTFADFKVAFDAAGLRFVDPIKVTPDFVDKATKQYNLGGQSLSGAAQPDLWKVLSSDKFRSLLFFPYGDDLPIRVEAFKNDGTTVNYLFVNDYTTNPKAAHYDVQGDWARFYKSTNGDYLKVVSDISAETYSIAQADAALKPFTDFYFHADGLYVIPANDINGPAFLLIGKNSKYWVKLRVGRVQEPDPSIKPDANFIADLVAKGMKPYGTFFDNTRKDFRLHYNLNADLGTVDLVWITDADGRYTEGNYLEMAKNKAQYKTMPVIVEQDGKITFKEPLVVGSVTYNGLTWDPDGAPKYAPNVEGMECTIRTPLQNDDHPLEYFFTYPVNKYECGTPVFMPNTRLCLPTSADNIAGMTGTERYLFYPYSQLGANAGTPAGPCAMELFPVGKGQRIDIKSFKEGTTSSTVKIEIASYKVEADRMIFTKGAASGFFVDKDGANTTEAQSAELVKPLERLLFGPKGFHVYKAENVGYEAGKHYFFLVSADPTYPFWIKVREG